MSRQKKLAPIPAHRGLGVRRKEFDLVASMFDAFQSTQRALVLSLDNDIASFKREIELREAMKLQTLAVSK